MGFFEQQEKVGKQNNLDRPNKLIILVPEIVVTPVTFWSKDKFCFVSDCRNPFNSKIKKLINEQIIFSLTY